MAYCTIGQAKSKGAKGDDAAIVARIAAATELVDAFTGEWFEPREATIVGRVSSSGRVPVPRRIISIASVTPIGWAVALSPTAYRVRTSALVGDSDAIELAGSGASDITILGAEPWAGGFANVLGRTDRVEIEGTFGYEDVPHAVADATALLVAGMNPVTNSPSTARPSSDVSSLSVEGYRVDYVDSAGGVVTSLSTGNTTADRLLSPYRRTKARVA